MSRDTWNACRHRAGDAAGHYESWFQRANHPDRPLAFWIRYTIFSPKGRPEQAIGELWAVLFDGETGSLVAVKEELPLSACSFASTGLKVQIGEASLDSGALRGRANGGDRQLAWDLSYASQEPPLLLLPRGLYGGAFPKAKALVGSPLARFDGTIQVADETIPVDGWLGSQNHNWGSKHTDQYAWGQVAGFDDAPDAHLEISTARVKLGPLWTPWMTLVVLRLAGKEYALNSLAQAVKAHGSYDFFHWGFASRDQGLEISGTISAAPDAFVALPYGNPPGGTKTCLNSKIASCHVTLRRPGQPLRTLSTGQRAAFEILTDEVDHGVPRLDVRDGRGCLGRGRFA